jgi:hypothetical protein
VRKIVGSCPGQEKTKDYKSVFVASLSTGFARNQNNVSEWSDMLTCRLLFQWASTIKIQLSVVVLSTKQTSSSSHWKLTCLYIVTNGILKVYYFEWVSEWLLFNANSAIFQLYYGENKLVFNEMMMKFAFRSTRRKPPICCKSDKLYYHWWRRNNKFKKKVPVISKMKYNLIVI